MATNAALAAEVLADKNFVVLASGMTIRFKLGCSFVYWSSSGFVGRKNVGRKWKEFRKSIITSPRKCMHEFVLPFAVYFYFRTIPSI